jgi:hypothetical protein
VVETGKCQPYHRIHGGLRRRGGLLLLLLVQRLGLLRGVLALALAVVVVIITTLGRGAPRRTAEARRRAHQARKTYRRDGSGQKVTERPRVVAGGGGGVIIVVVIVVVVTARSVEGRRRRSGEQPAQRATPARRSFLSSLLPLVKRVLLSHPLGLFFFLIRREREEASAAVHRDEGVPAGRRPVPVDDTTTAAAAAAAASLGSHLVQKGTPHLCRRCGFFGRVHFFWQKSDGFLVGKAKKKYFPRLEARPAVRVASRAPSRGGAAGASRFARNR